MDGIVGGVPVSGSSGWQGGEVFSEVQRWNRIEAVSQMKTPWFHSASNVRFCASGEFSTANTCVLSTSLQSPAFVTLDTMITRSSGMRDASAFPIVSNCDLRMVSHFV